MIRSMLADQPNWPVRMAQGDLTSLWETTTFSTLSPRTFLRDLVRPSKAFSSSSRFFFSSSVSSSSKSLVMSTSFLPSNSLRGEGVLVNGVGKVENLEVLGLEGVEEGRLLNSLDVLAGDVVHVLLVLRHAGDVVLKGGEVLARLGGVVAEELGKDVAVLAVLVDTKLDVLGESSVELVELLLVLGDLGEQLKGLLDDVLLDDLHDLVLLESLTGQVEGQVLGVDHTLDEGEPLRNEVGGVVSDEDTADVELDVVLGLLGLEQVEGSALGDEEDGAELELTLNGEVLDGKVVLPVVAKRLVECTVLLLGDLSGVASPDGLGLVELLLLDLALLDLLGLLLVILLLVLVDFLDLGLVVVLLVLLLLGLLVGDLGLGLLQDVKVDGVGDKLGVLLDDLLDLGLLQVVGLLILEVEDDLGTAADLLALGVGLDGEGAASAGLPDVLLVIVVLGDDSDSVGNEVCGVETNTELTDHGNVGTGGEGLHELLGTGTGDRTEVVDKIGLGHTDTSVLDGEGLVGLIGDDVETEVLVRVELARVRKGLVADLVKRIGTVGDQFSEEDLLVGVDGVDDEGKKLRDLGLELECLGHDDGCVWGIR